MTDQPSSLNYAFCPGCGSSIVPTDRACRRCGTITPLGERNPLPISAPPIAASSSQRMEVVVTDIRLPLDTYWAIWLKFLLVIIATSVIVGIPVYMIIAAT